MSDGYVHAAAALDRVWSKRASVKEAVLGKHNSKLSGQQKKMTYAILCETLKYSEVGERDPTQRACNHGCVSV